MDYGVELRLRMDCILAALDWHRADGGRGDLIEDAKVIFDFVTGQTKE